jgi:hypothetical protein
MEGVAAVARVAVPLVLALVLAGCTSHEASPPTGVHPPIGASPSTGAQPSTRLAAATTSGSADVGSFLAGPGDLWVGGRCSGGDLEVHVDPVAVLPIPCRALAGGQFLNQIVMTRSTTVTVSVAAAGTVTWDLQLRQ